MMNKLVLKSSAVLTALLIAGPVLASAASATTVGGDYTSSANLTLQAGTGPVNPVDPTDPTIPVNPVDPGTPGTPGNLTVDYGSTLNFGTQSISTNTQTYYAHPDMVTNTDGTNTRAVPAYAQVTDQSGDLAGWTLTVTQASDLHLASGTSTDPGYALTGAQIGFSGGTVTAGNGNTAAAPSTVVASGTLTPGVATELVSAGAGQGAGTWLYNFGDMSAYDATSVDTTNPTDQTKVATTSPITLTIPGGLTEKAAAYTTDLYWSLQAVPGNASSGNFTTLTK